MANSEYDDFNDQDDFDYGNSDSSNTGEEITQKPTIDRFFDPEEILFNIEKTFRGFQKKNNKWVKLKGVEEVARDEFINVAINSLRSVINQQNMISKLGEEEIETILLEKNLEFIDLCEDEITLEDDYFESVINIYDHALQLFMGLVQGGWNAQTLKEIYAGVAHSPDTNQQKNENSFLRLKVGDKDVFNYGEKP